MGRSVKVAAMTAVVVVGGLLGACGNDNKDTGTVATTPTTAATAAAPADLTVTATEYSFAAPPSVRGGLVRVNLQNTGKEAHQAQLLRLNDGVTPGEIAAAFQAGDNATFFRKTTIEGGPSVVAAGGRQAVTNDLKPGNFLLMCFVPAPDGVPHLVKGMVKPLTVEAPPVQAKAPEADGVVELKDFSFGLPPVKSGPVTLSLTNRGPQPHEMQVAKLARGKTLADFTAYLSASQGKPPTGPPPYQPAGGMGGIGAGHTGYADLDLQPGSYVAYCTIPDPADGKPHAAKGMVQPFEVK